MNRKLLLVALVLAVIVGGMSQAQAASKPRAPQPDGPGGKWRLTLNDFGRALDHWKHTLGGAGCGGGTVGRIAVDRKGDLQLGDSGKWGNCAQVSDPVRVKYGFFQATVYLSKEELTYNQWPTFWMSGANWPHWGEIDIMEGWKHAGEECAIFHYDLDGPEPVSRGNIPYDWRQAGGGCFKIHPGWNTFGVWWRPDRIMWYYNGKLVSTLRQPFVNTGHPMQMVIDNKVSGTNKVGGTLTVRDIRAWSKVW